MTNDKDKSGQASGGNDCNNSEETITTGSKGLLRWVEKMGNKLPHPFWLFAWICIIIVVLSAITSYFNVSAIDPATDEDVFAQNLISGESLRNFVESMVRNFAHFAPFGLVLVMLMGVSVAERSGFLTVVLRTIAFSVPKKIVLPVIFIIGACGNIGSDAGIVIVPPIAALIFSQMGLHPIAGLVAGYAGATAGFTANFLIAGTDVLLAGISTEVAEAQGLAEVSPTANWYFMIISTIMLGFAGAFIVRRFTIPRCKAFTGADHLDTEFQEHASKLKPEEKKGLKRAGFVVLFYIIIIAALVVPPGAPLRDPVEGTIVPSPFLRGLVPVLFLLFALPGYVYGKATGTIKTSNDALKFMEQGMKELSGYIVLMFIIAQFIFLFGQSNLDTILAISGAKFLQNTGIEGPLLFTLFMIIVAILNIFMGSGSAKWAVFAPIFIPMLARLEFSPAFVQLMYRIGDSITNAITPLYPYFPLLLGWISKYDKRVGIGTVISLLIPYAVILFIMWTILLFIWYAFNLPVGVGEFIYIN